MHKTALTLLLGILFSTTLPGLAQNAVPAPKPKTAAMPRAAAMQGTETAARGVLQRLLGDRFQNVTLEIRPELAIENRDGFEFAAQNGQLTIRGSTGVALCRGFYEYLRANHLGMVGWAGKQLDLPAQWPDAPKTRINSPYQFRFYYNVVTYGYTMPYWTWERWEQELDWMALHGVNFPLALVATEAIGDRVWKQIGLTQPEIDAFYTGPAHLPWQRMGNITKHDGPLPQSWHADQIAMQHKILRRMGELGIEPIVPGFAGFVPRGIQRAYPDVTLHELSWGGFGGDKHAFLLAPSHPLFPRIGKLFIEEWEKEFGKCRYYLVDSFNEMELPKTSQPVAELLAEYSEAIYSSIKAGNPDAVWVIQGWMFGFQRNIWNKETVKALLSKVPDDKMLILDEACDYNGTWWHNGMNWEVFNGWHNKPWVYGVIPNMGGKTAYTGILDFYASDIFKALKSPAKGRLVGYGFAPEGTENNEVIYELMSDLAWKTDPVKLDDWIQDYCTSRYGGYPESMRTAWDLYRKTCYGTFTDHPGFGWQTGSCSHGSVNRDPRFLDGVQAFLACAGQLGKSPLYQGDAIEQSAIALGLKADDWFILARQAHDIGDNAIRDQAAARGLELLTEADRLLESHPLHRLQRWIDFARAHGDDAAQKKAYEANARRLITVWGPPINDYSRRLWSGLIRDFYRERMRLTFAGLKSGQGFNRGPWEEAWVRAPGVSPCAPYANPLAEAARLVAKACTEPMPKVRELRRETIGDWAPGQVSTEWKTVEWRISTEQLRKLKAIQFNYTGGGCRLDAQWVALVADGKEIARDAHFGFAGIPDSQNVYKLKAPAGLQANNDCLIRASVRTDGGTNSRGSVLLLFD